MYYVTVNSIETIFKLQEDEVSEVKWINLEDLGKWFKDKPEQFVPSFQNTIDNIKEIYENKN